METDGEERDRREMWRGDRVYKGKIERGEKVK